MEQRINRRNSREAQELIDSFKNIDKIISDDDYYEVSNFFDNIIESYSLNDDQWNWLYELKEKILDYENTAAFDAEYKGEENAKEMKNGC